MLGTAHQFHFNLRTVPKRAAEGDLIPGSSSRLGQTVEIVEWIDLVGFLFRLVLLLLAFLAQLPVADYFCDEFLGLSDHLVFHLRHTESSIFAAPHQRK